MSKFLIIDGTALVFRGFYAIPKLSTTDGQPTNAIYGFYTILFNLLLEQKPDYFVICFDRAEETDRKKEFKEYKAQRTKAPDDLYSQIAPIKNILQKGSLCLLEKAGTEADDLIATLALKNTQLSPDLDIYIYSSDLDLTQLVGGRIKILKPGNSQTGNTLMDTNAVVQKYGFLPKFVPDYKGLHGDSSDNIPGVRGIGTKTATDLIQKFGHLDDIYNNIDKITGATQTKLINEKEQAYFCKKLATLYTDIECEWSLEQYKPQNIKIETILNLLKELEITKLNDKITRLKNIFQIVESCDNQQSLF
jgi:DNA polymerase-1